MIVTGVSDLLLEQTLGKTKAEGAKILVNSRSILALKLDLPALFQETNGTENLPLKCANRVK